MIINAQTNDFFDTYSDAKITVYVNEIEIQFAIVADTTLGFVEYMTKDKDGQFIIEDDEIKTEKVNGDVMIQIEKKASER